MSPWHGQACPTCGHPPPAVRPASLMASAEVLEHFRVTSPTLVRWRRSSAFPAPVAELKCGAVWDTDEVRAWHADRSGVRLAALRAVRAGVTKAQAARDANVNPKTIDRWVAQAEARDANA